MTISHHPPPSSSHRRRPLATNIVNASLTSIKHKYNDQNIGNTAPPLTFSLRPIKSKHARQSLYDKESAERQYVTHRITTEYGHLQTAITHHNDNDIVKPDHLYTTTRKFAELPLSQRTLTALDAAKYRRLTNIQRASIPYTLMGMDVLGNAETGSGKTLAFVIPCIEYIWRENWNRNLDGLCSLIISPTRELAIQIFDVLRVVGCNHAVSAGLVIGGKSFEDESSKITQMNILVCTPGRLLQHLEQSYTFTVDTLRILVIDEVDRILDMGFQATVNDILGYLPKQRQTLLFSATVNDSVSQIARLSLTRPVHIDVNPIQVKSQDAQTSTNDTTTREKLDQSYTVIDASVKLDMLYSFIKTHLRSKSIVFVSSGKQVRYLYEVFRRIRPGIPLMHIHGKMSQPRRMQMYYDFCNKQYACMFATDIAARGLDFPHVDWILQLDCPDSPATYVHRVGRTARYKSKGKAMLCLLPSEMPFIETLKSHQHDTTAIKRVRVNEAQLRSPLKQIQAFLAESTELAELTRKAYISYIRSVYLQQDKSIFDVSQVPLEPLALAMGLQAVPHIKFVGTMKTRKNMPYALQSMLDKHVSHTAGMNNTSDTSSVDKLLARRNMQYERRLNEIIDLSDSSDDTAISGDVIDDLLVTKSHDLTHDDEMQLASHALDTVDDGAEEYQQHIKRQEQKALLFESYVQKSNSHLLQSAAADMMDQTYTSDVAHRVAAADVVDRATDKQRVRDRRLKQKRALRAAAAERTGAVASHGAVLHAVKGSDNEANNDSGSDTYQQTTNTAPHHNHKRSKLINDNATDEIDQAEQMALQILR